MVSATRGQEYPCAKPLATFQIHCTASAVFWGNRSLAASSDAGRSCWANAAAIIIPTFIGPFFEIIVSETFCCSPRLFRSIIRERSAKLRKKKDGPVAGGATTVARQGTAGPTSAPASSAGSNDGNADAPASDGKQHVARQQPKKTSRAKRKQARPESGGDSTKE